MPGESLAGSEKSTPVRVLVVEGDDATFKTWQRQLVGRAAVFRAATFDEAWSHTEPELWRQHPYDRVLLDLCLPDGVGIDLLDRFNAVEPTPPIAVITSALDSRQALALHGRCTIALPKPVDRESLLGALKILGAARPASPVVAEFARAHRLSHQETRLLLAASCNATNKQAAEELGCAPATVRTYWVRIFEKTQCRSARDVLAQLFRFAVGQVATVTSGGR